PLGEFGRVLQKAAQETDFGEAGAQVIVQILGDAGALALKFVLAFDVFQPAAHPFARGAYERNGKPPRRQQAKADAKPGRLIEERPHRNGKKPGVLAPDGVAVASDAMKNVIAWRNMAVNGPALRTGVIPCVLEALEFVFELDAHGRSEAQTGVLKF